MSRGCVRGPGENPIPLGAKVVRLKPGEKFSDLMKRLADEGSPIVIPTERPKPVNRPKF